MGKNMFLGMPDTDVSVYQSRRKELMTILKELYPDVRVGAVILFANFENIRTAFQQESSFFYMTGITNPATVFTLDVSGKSRLYITEYAHRLQWLDSFGNEHEIARTHEIDEVVPLGEKHENYQAHPFFTHQAWSELIVYINHIIDAGGKIFTLNSSKFSEYIEQRFILERLITFIPQLRDSIIDISSVIAEMRSRKDMQEIEHIYKALEITVMAQEAAAHAIAHDVSECEVQASLEYIYTASCVQPAFPTIVASGKNSLVLHHQPCEYSMCNGDLVIIDSGAQYKHYCADITRTYPVSGVFTQRQKEVYDLVRETQEYVARHAKSGYWLSYDKEPERSLNHLARKFLEERGYGHYIVHGIGHFLGLDAHDVGDVSKPLQEGNVITIEPGIYIPEEQIGIRIEDNYWITKKGAICLSDHLPKKAEDVEMFVQQRFSDEDEDQEEYKDCCAECLIDDHDAES